jgi:autotransporter-associated beta strand protein
MAIVSAMALVGFMTGTVQAQTTYTWTNTVGGAKNWIDGANWLGGSAPSPISGDTVNLTANIAADTTLTLGGDRTAEFWSFGHNSSTKNWIVNTGNKIILAGTTPTINVVKNTATLNNVLDGTAGLTKNGAGTLALLGANTFTGDVLINQGKIQAQGGTLGQGTQITFAASAILQTMHTLTYPNITFPQSVTVNSGAIATFYIQNQFYSATLAGPVSGDGTIYCQHGDSGYGELKLSNSTNSFTGVLQLGDATYAGLITVNSLGDSLNRIKLYAGTDTSRTPSGSIFTLGSGTASPLLFVNRQFELAGTAYGGAIKNNNGTSSNTIIVNTDLVITGTGNKTLTLGGSNIGDNTFAGSITNGASAVISVTKADAGKWILSGTNTYSGGTSVTAGKLVSVVGGSCSNSAVTVSGGTLGVSVTDTTMNWACKSLTHTAASTLEFAFGANTPSTTLAPLQVNGNVLFVVAPTVSCTGSSLPAGMYPLMTWTGAFFGVVPSSPTLPSGFTGILVLDNANKTLWLSVSASGSTKQPLTWKGPAGSSWVVNETVYTKWQDATTPTPVSTNYQETTVSGITVGDNVVFGTTGAGTVTLDTIVSPASVSVNTTANYTFSGTGSIAGPGALTKANSGSLTLSTTNGYSGGTLLSAGTLSIGINDALGSGPVVLSGGTLQSSDATARTLNNPVVLNGNTTVAGTGSLSFTNPGTGSVVVASTLTVNGSLNATIATALGGSGAITKAGTGTLKLTGTNSIGAVTVSAGLLTIDGGTTSNSSIALSGARMSIINGGTLSTVSGGALAAFSASNSRVIVTGGNGVTSAWNLNGGAIGQSGAAQPGSGNLNNMQMTIDGAGYAGSARVTGVGNLIWGMSYVDSTITLTNGGQMTVNGEIRTGSSYYSRTGNSDILIGGGTATSTFTGNNQAFYVGYGERPGSKNNDVTVSSGGVLSGIGNMSVGHTANTADTEPSTANKLTVTGTGTASMTGISVGHSTVAVAANANVVVVSNGGTLTTSGANYIGRATVSGANANANTATVTGTGSSWNAGNQTVYVGYTGNAGAVSTGNVFTVNGGGVVTNINLLTVKAANTLSLGAGGQIYAGAVTNAGTLAVGLDKNAMPACGNLAVTGNLNVNNATLDVSLTGTPTAPCVIASYGSLTGSFAATNGLPGTYKLEMNYKGQKQIAIVYSAAGTIIQFQ